MFARAVHGHCDSGEPLDDGERAEAHVTVGEPCGEQFQRKSGTVRHAVGGWVEVGNEPVLRNVRDDVRLGFGVGHPTVDEMVIDEYGWLSATIYADGANGVFDHGSRFHPVDAFVEEVSDFAEGFYVVDDDAGRGVAVGDGEHEFLAEAGGLEDGELVCSLVVDDLECGCVAVVVFGCAHCFCGLSRSCGMFCVGEVSLTH